MSLVFPVILQASIHLCDQLAADPNDRKRKAAGVDAPSINYELAIPACTKAFIQYPENPRIAYQLGRVMMITNRYQEAIYYFKQAMEKKYAPAFAYLGFIYISGLGVSPDLTKAKELINKANLYGYVPAKRVLANWDKKIVAASRSVTLIAPPSVPSKPMSAPASPISGGAPAVAIKAKKIDFSAYHFPDMMRALHDGDFKKMNSFRFFTVWYIGIMNNVISQPDNYSLPEDENPQSCYLLHKPTLSVYSSHQMIKILMNPGSKLRKEFMFYVTKISNTYKKPSVNSVLNLVMSLQMLEIMKQKVAKDGIRLISTKGCLSEITKRIYANMFKFVKG